jgi:hypothetical protein
MLKSIGRRREFFSKYLGYVERCVYTMSNYLGIQTGIAIYAPLGMSLYVRRFASSRPRTGIITRKYTKKTTLAICPIIMYGSSTGIAPNHPRRRISARRNQKKIRCNGRNDDERTGEEFKNGRANKHTNTSAIAATPPSLSGMLRRIAYTGRKYHSGTI